VNSFFCSNRFAWLLATLIETLHRAQLYDINEAMSFSHDSYRTTLGPPKRKKREKPDLFARDMEEGMCTTQFTIW